MMNAAMPVAAQADWLLWSLETIDPMEKNASLKTGQKLKAATALKAAMKEHWIGSDADLVAAADVSAAALSGFKNEGFTRRNHKMIPVAKAIGVDFKSLCNGKVVKLNPTETQSESSSDLVSLAKEFVGTPKESLATDMLRLLRSKS